MATVCHAGPTPMSAWVAAQHKGPTADGDGCAREVARLHERILAPPREGDAAAALVRMLEPPRARSRAANEGLQSVPASGHVWRLKLQFHATVYLCRVSVELERFRDYGPTESDMYDWNDRRLYDDVTKEFHSHMEKIGKKLNSAVKDIENSYKVWDKILKKHRNKDT